MGEPESQVLETLRDLDPERHLACLYLSDSLRVATATLYAFDAEIARIPSLVSEPMPGEIRLQWWRDLVASSEETNAAAGPLADLLLQSISKHRLPRNVFTTYLDARIFDLYQDPMPDQGSFEGYLGETVSSLFQLVALLHGAKVDKVLADACGYSGVAFGIMRLVSNLASARKTGRIQFPMSLVTACGLDRDQWLQNAPDHRHKAVLDELLDQAADNFARARAAIPQLSKDVQPVFLPLAFVPPLIRKARKYGLSTFDKPVKLNPLYRQFVAFKAGATGRL